MLKKLAAVLLFAVLGMLVYRLFRDPAGEILSLTIAAMAVAAVLILEIDRVLARPKEQRRKAARDSVLGLGFIVGMWLAAYWIPFPWGFVFALAVCVAVLAREYLFKRTASGAGARESG